MDPITAGLAHDNGIAKAGFVRPGALPGLDPGEIAQVCAVSYFQRTAPARRRVPGVWSLSSRGEDYHAVLRRRLAAFAEGQLAAFSPDFPVPYRVAVDTEEISERSLAVLSGLGAVLKNRNLYVPGVGSFVFLGVIYWNIKVLERFPIRFSEIDAADYCGECRRCADACPGKALDGRGGYCMERCVSFLTQVKRPLTREEADTIGSRLYGCDVCQAVCPLNRGIPETRAEEFLAPPEEASVECAEFFGASNRELKERFGHVSGNWRGWNPLRRNALLIHRLAERRDPSLAGEGERLLKAALEADSPLIRDTAKYILQWREEASDGEAHEQENGDGGHREIEGGVSGRPL